LNTASAAATRESVAELMVDRLGVLAERGVLTCGIAISTRLPTSMCSGAVRTVLRWIGLESPSLSTCSCFAFSDEGEELHAVNLDDGEKREKSMRLVPENRVSFPGSKVSLHWHDAICRDSADFGLGDCLLFLFNKLSVTNADFGRLDAVSILDSTSRFPSIANCIP
jgi:hypothetical protein